MCAIDTTDRDILAKTKSGKYDLVCGINSWRKDRFIDPRLITGFSSDTGSGTWLFVNGYASNCKLVDSTAAITVN